MRSRVVHLAEERENAEERARDARTDVRSAATAQREEGDARSGGVRQACVDRQCNFRDGLPRGDEFVLWSQLHILNIENLTNRYIIKNNKRKFWTACSSNYYSPRI